VPAAIFEIEKRPLASLTARVVPCWPINVTRAPGTGVPSLDVTAPVTDGASCASAGVDGASSTIESVNAIARAAHGTRPKRTTMERDSRKKFW
jgi:hypothetical protein